MARLSVALIGWLAFAATLGGCTSAEVSPGPLVHQFKGKRVALIDASGPPEDYRFNGWQMAWDVRRGEEATAALERELLRLYAYDVKDRSELERVLAEQDIQRSALINRSTAVEVGRLAGLDGILVVQARGEFIWAGLLVLGVQKSLDVRLINIETGTVVWAGEASLRDFSIIPLPPSAVLWESPEKRMARALGEELRDLVMLW